MRCRARGTTWGYVPASRFCWKLGLLVGMRSADTHQYPRAKTATFANEEVCCSTRCIGRFTST